MVDDETRVTALVAEAYALADGDLAGIDDAARELASVARGDVRVIAAAIRQVRAQVESGGDRATKQVASLLRRALEIGTWDWESYERSG